MPLQVLQEIFGFPGFRPGQEEAVSSFHSGQDTIVLMPTGGGKSLCYQVPGILAAREGRGLTLVISPLISLMKDQVERLQRDGVSAAFLNSSQDLDGWKKTHSDVWNGRVDLLYVSPERMASAPFRRMVRQLPVAMAVVDEAHCVSNWGHDFRKTYSKLFYLKRTLKLPVMAVTATATPRVLEDIIAQLRLKEPAIIRGRFRRENLAFSLLHERREEDRLEKAIALLKERGFHKKGEGRAIIYCATRKKVEKVADTLKAAKIPCARYHGGRTDLQRERAHEAYDQGKRRILVATNAFGMGVDHPDVRLVLHFQVPGSLDAYYQEAGRAGRDGQSAECVAFFGTGDLVTHKMLIRRSKDRTREQLAARLAEVDRVDTFALSLTCRQMDLARHFGSEDAIDLAPCKTCDACTQPRALQKVIGVARKVRAVARAERQAARAHDVSSDATAQIVALVQGLNRPESIKRVAMTLRGSRAKEVKRRGLTKHLLHGVLKEIPQAALERRIEELISQGILEQKGIKYPTVWPAGKRVRAAKGEGKPRKKKTLGCPLKDALADYRKKTARKMRWKSYMVFTNKVIDLLADKRPSRLEELHDISGLGPRRIERFGVEVLDILRSYDEDHPDS